MTKAKKVLNMYDALIRGEEIKMQSFCSEHKISLPTFRRYMSLVRNFLWEKHLKDVVYDKEKLSYYIKNNG